MKILGLSYFYVFLLSVNIVLSQESFPAPLKKHNFRKTLEQSLHLVEFYSPYCSHCTSFAPVWEKTWEDFHSEGSRLGIAMSQVDCVESGDLCNDEKITAYPTLRLYGPNGFIKSYPKSLGRTEAAIVKFCREQALEFADEALLPDSKSELISTDLMVQLLAKPTDKPYLISLWPSKHLEDLNVIDESLFDTPFLAETISFQRKWRLISSQLAPTNILPGHFNCLSNSNICKNLISEASYPSIILILPEMKAAKVIAYDRWIHPLEPKSIIDFAERVTEAAQCPNINRRDLVESKNIPLKLPLLDFIPKNAETFFVFLYDDETVVAEDFEILPNLIEPLAQLPHTHLAKSTDMKIFDLVELQKRNLYRSINYEKSEPRREFNEQRNALEISTTVPTLLCFKEYSILPEVFHSFAPHDIRDQFKVIDWMKRNAEQSISELTQSTFAHTMKLVNQKEKIIIQLLDSRNETDSVGYLNHFITACHDYTDRDLNNIYEDLISERGAKNVRVQEQKKQKDFKPANVAKALTEQIIQREPNKFTALHLDVAKNSKLLEDLGCNPGDLNNGDVIIVDGLKFYDYDLFGRRLSTRESPYALRKTLEVLNGAASNSISGKVRNLPYGGILTVLHSVYQIDITRYFLIVLLLIVVFKSMTKLFGRHPIFFKRRNQSHGILDGTSTKSE